MYCPKCGNQVADTEAFCRKCGNQLKATAKVSSAASPAPTPGNPPTSSTGSESKTYASFWRRFFAYLIDYLILVVAIVVISRWLGRIVVPIFWPLVVIGGWLYYAITESSKPQATIGKMALGIKVTALGGERIGFGQASGRYFGKIVSGLTLGVGYLMAGFTERRQALHDKMASTLVVRAPLSAAEIATAGPAPPVSAFTIVLIILAGIFFGPFAIGILAGIAIPAYQDYTIRAQVTQGLVSAEAYKIAVSEAMAGGRDPSAITSDNLNVARSRLPPYVKKIDVISGTVAIEYGGPANNNIHGKTLVLVPGKSAAGELVWVCGRSRAPPDVQLVIDNAGALTTVPERFLPLACRHST
jgi:uncharacterized RDD family membrane protein YckC/Tfp pilus assembly major pilin PilA